MCAKHLDRPDLVGAGRALMLTGRIEPSPSVSAESGDWRIADQSISDIAERKDCRGWLFRNLRA